MPNRKPILERSPGGSVIHRYAALARARTGLPDDATAQFAEAREKVYERFFGEVASIYHEVIPFVPHIDIHTYGRDERRGFFTLVTSGMSDLPMSVPPGADVPKRVELIFYCPEPKDEYLETLRWLARFPHDNKTWVGSGHTIPNGNPPEPLWGSSVLDTILLMPTIISKPDRTLAQELILDGDAVEFLWVVPLTTAECGLKLERGFAALLELFGRKRHPSVFDAGRKSYV